MNKERIEQIMEKVTKRNLANVLCGNKTSEVDNEILELLNEVTRLTNNWNELEEWLKEERARFNSIANTMKYSRDSMLDNGSRLSMCGNILDKMKEIKENK